MSFRSAAATREESAVPLLSRAPERRRDRLAALAVGRPGGARSGVVAPASCSSVSVTAILRQSRSSLSLNRANAKGLNEGAWRKEANLFWPHKWSHNYVPDGESTQPVKPHNEDNKRCGYICASGRCARVPFLIQQFSIRNQLRFCKMVLTLRRYLLPRNLGITTSRLVSPVVWRPLYFRHAS